MREALCKDITISRHYLAQTTGRSLGWVKKWRRRLLAAGLHNDEALRSRSRVPHHPPKRTHPEVVKRILEIRDHPPENLQRTPGPRAILYYLHRQTDLLEQDYLLPRSTRTVWQILDQHGRIFRKPKVEHHPLEPVEPMACWQMDFKDVTTVRSGTSDKKQHQVEAFNFVDAGSSLLLESLPAEDYTAETALLTVAQVLVIHGLPDKITFDRDTRFVGPWTGRDFPSALVRFLLCLGVEPDISPPKQPQHNPYVERFNKSYEYECLQIHRPATLAQAIEVTEQYKQHYNFERPSQAATCKNKPPAFAFDQFPVRPRPPEVIDTDHWLQTIDRRCYKRRVDASGTIEVSKHNYYVSRKLAAQFVVLRVNARQKCFEVEVGGHPFKTIPIKGLHHMFLGFQGFVELMRREALSEWRTTQYSLRRRITMLVNSRGS